MNLNFTEGGVTSPKGFMSSGISCGIKGKSLKDLALIMSTVPCNSAGVYTTNKLKAAPVLVTKKHLENKTARAIIANSGNANSCTGEKGIEDAEKICSFVAKAFNIKEEDVLVASTGIIGVKLDVDSIENSIPALIEGLSNDDYKDASEAIMTTDTVPKTLAVEFEIQGKSVVMGAIAKGSGMIHPNMGTMLSFITTDVNISSNLLEKALKESVRISYNRISVDGDTSTNDMALIMANGLSGNPVIEKEDGDYKIFLEALKKLNVKIAKMIAKDGEGSTKLIECRVLNIPSEKDGEIIGKSVICSNLVKTAFFGCDANWGRILDAVGYSGVDFDINKLQVSLESSKGNITMFKNGEPVEFSVGKAENILSESEVSIILDFNLGNYSLCCWGCDLTYDYIKINGRYMS